MKTGFIDRELATIIKEAAKYFSVITVTGPRQSGKTTLPHGYPYYKPPTL